jgi:hypothetical protein
VNSETQKLPKKSNHKQGFTPSDTENIIGSNNIFFHQASVKQLRCRPQQLPATIRRDAR